MHRDWWYWCEITQRGQHQDKKNDRKVQNWLQRETNLILCPSWCSALDWWSADLCGYLLEKLYLWIYSSSFDSNLNVQFYDAWLFWSVGLVCVQTADAKGHMGKYILIYANYLWICSQIFSNESHNLTKRVKNRLNWLENILILIVKSLSLQWH